jgi:hypothetical protein
MTRHQGQPDRTRPSARRILPAGAEVRERQQPRERRRATDYCGTAQSAGAVATGPQGQRAQHREADSEIDRVMGTRDGYAIMQALAGMDKKTVAAVREIVEQIGKLV